MRKLIHPFKYNSLTIVLSGLFVICIAAQSVVGWRLQNDILVAHGRASIGYWTNLSAGAFLEGLAVNWQAAFLQLSSLIFFTGFLYQRGSPQSRDPLKAKGKKRENKKAARRFTWVYRNSLVLAFLSLFACSLVLHVAFGAKAFNEERALTGQPLISVAAFMLTAKFWSATLQTWQAEYLTITLFVVLSAFLRQQGSAESKPVESKNETTGEANK
jgi:hypothetical protein